MLNRTRRFVLAALPVAAFAVMSMVGATASELGATKATVPFAFDLNGERMEAGQYKFEPMYGSWLLTVRPEQGKPVTILGTPLGNPTDLREPKLVFYLVDGKHYLAEVWTAGTGAGKKVPMKKAIEYTAKSGGVTRIEVAMRR